MKTNVSAHLDFKKRYENVYQFINEVAPGFKGEKNTQRFRDNVRND